jgi:AcrR family transcriptional regulator
MDKTERRLDILRAARRVFATKGYHDTKVDEIVAAARVAKGTFYLYFRDKRSIFIELVDAVFTRIGSAILRVDTGGDVAGQIQHNIRAILAVLLDDPETTQILMTHAAGLDPAFAAKIASFYAGVKALLAESLRDGQQLKIVAAGDPELYATFTIGALKELLFELTTSARPRSREQVVGELYALLERGYLRVQGPGRAMRAAADRARKAGGRGRRR